MKVLVLGGTGAMGMHLVQLLAKNGIEVVVTSRAPKNSEGTVSYVQGNAQSVEFLQEILSEKWDAIVDFMVYTTARFEDRVKLLLDATSQYIFLSSSRVYADSKQPITENSPRLLDICRNEDFLSTDEYSLAKARQENILIGSSRKNWTIIRPYITYSKDRLQLGVFEKEGWLYRALHGRTIVFSQDINSRTTTLTYGLDVSKGIRSVIGNSKALGEVFHITAQDSVAWNVVLAVYLDVLERHLGYRPKVLLQNLEDFCKCHPEKYQILYDRLFDRKFDNCKIRRYIDVEHFTNVEAGLKKCLEEFLMHPGFSGVNWRIEALKDRKTKERTPLREICGIKQKIKYLLFRYLMNWNLN